MRSIKTERLACLQTLAGQHTSFTDARDSMQWAVERGYAVVVRGPIDDRYEITSAGRSALTKSEG